MRKFLELQLQILSMNDTETYFKFMGGFKPQVKQELKRCNAKDLYTAMSVIETQLKYKETSSNKPNSILRDKAAGEGDRNKFQHPSGTNLLVIPLLEGEIEQRRT